MSKVRIPEADYSSLSAIVAWPDQQFESVVRVLGMVGIEIMPDEGLAELLQQKASVEQSTATQFCRVVRSLHLTRLASNTSIDEFCKSVVDAVRADSPPSQRFGATELNKLATRLRAILEVRNLRLSAKATDLYFEQEKALVDSRILTDARPVFDDEGSLSIAGFLLSVTLKMELHESGEHRETFVAIDESDVDRLMSQLERTKRKLTSLRKLLSETRVPVIEVKTR